MTPKRSLLPNADGGRQGSALERTTGKAAVITGTDLKAGVLCAASDLPPAHWARVVFPEGGGLEDF